MLWNVESECECYKNVSCNILSNRNKTFSPIMLCFRPWLQLGQMYVFNDCHVRFQALFGYELHLIKLLDVDLIGVLLHIYVYLRIMIANTKLINVDFHRTVELLLIKHCFCSQGSWGVHVCCLHLKMEFRSCARVASVVWHLSLLLMNSFNKTEAAVFSCSLCFLRAFPFISFFNLNIAFCFMSKLNKWV